MAEQLPVVSSEQATDDEIPPPLIILNGLVCQRNGLIKNDEDKLVGQIVHGDTKMIHHRGSRCDAHGHVYSPWSPYGVEGWARTLTPSQARGLMSKDGEEATV